MTHTCRKFPIFPRSLNPSPLSSLLPKFSIQIHAHKSARVRSRRKRIRGKCLHAYPIDPFTPIAIPYTSPPSFSLLSPFTSRSFSIFSSSHSLFCIRACARARRYYLSSLFFSPLSIRSHLSFFIAQCSYYKICNFIES